MPANNGAIHMTRFTQNLPLRLLAVALVSTLSADATGQASLGQTITQVSGTDTETLNLLQSEAAATVSVFDDRQIEVIAVNDENELFTFTDTTRSVFQGASQMGWYFRERTQDDPHPPWQHGRLLPGVGAASGVAILWGDPGIASAPDDPNVVLMGSLMVPNANFPNAICIDAAGNPAGCIAGPVGSSCNSVLGGACIAGSNDGGKTFEMRHCFSDMSPGCNTSPNGAHFYDGMDIALGPGTDPPGYVVMIDTDTRTEALWEIPHAGSGSTFSQRRFGTGPMGLLAGDLEEIRTHPRIRVDAEGRVWRLGRRQNELKINRLGRNAAPRVLTALHNRRLATTVLGVPPSVTDPGGDLSTRIRFGPQFDFDVGKTEAGEDELRYVYLVEDGQTFYIQVGFCDVDLQSCREPGEWRSAPATGQPWQFHPTIKYGLDERLDPPVPRWMVTYYQLNSPATEVAIFAGAPTRDGAGVHSLDMQQATPYQVPCPDERGTVNPVQQEDDYWGDYDDMAFNSARCSFIRPFTDSSLGCVSRQRFTSSHQHVSAVELPCADPLKYRRVTLDFGFWVNNDEFLNAAGDFCWAAGPMDAPHAETCLLTNRGPPIHVECAVSPEQPVFEDTVFSSPCVVDEVVGHVDLKCELLDEGTVRVTIRARLNEGENTCNPPEKDRTSEVKLVPAGESLGDFVVKAENVADPTNGAPYDHALIFVPPGGLVNEQL
jgi:hypothetical protein